MKVFIIAGPTAAGKTSVAISLALRLGTVIVSADSRQCYRELNIGVARPSAEELNAVKHYFTGIVPVAQPCNAAGFETLALQYLDNIFTEHTTAVVCGGSGLYIKALCEGLDEMPPVDSTISRETEAMYNEKGLKWLQQTVEKEDPEFHRTGEIQNPARLLRALSFIRTTGHSITRYQTQTIKKRPFGIFKAGLELPREELYDRINSRTDEMMANGLLDEAAQLKPYRHLKPLQTVGYMELFDYLDGKCTLKEAINLIKQHTRNYAKRQLTWFRKDKEMTWFRADDKDVAEKIIIAANSH